MNLSRSGLALALAALALAALAFAPGSLPAQTVRVAGIDSIVLGGVVQPRFDTSTVDGQPDTAWELRRARLRMRMYAAGWIQAAVEADFGRGASRLTDGFITLQFDPRFQVRVGQFKKPFDTLMLVDGRVGPIAERDGLPRGAVFPTPNRLARLFGYNDRDIGAEASGTVGRATWTAGFWNGSGPNSSETDDGKGVGARAEVGMPGGWRALGSWAGVRRSAPGDEPAADARWSNGFELAAVTGRLHEPGFKGLFQVMFGDGAFNEVTEQNASFLTLQAIGVYHVPVYRVPYLIGFEPVARWAWSDPDDDGEDDEASLWTGGVNLYHHPLLKTQYQVDYVAPAVGDGATAFRFQATLGF